MPSKRRCGDCGVMFPTIDALNIHYKLTSHIRPPYKCEPCKRPFKTLSSLKSHLESNIRLHPKTDARVAVAQTDGGGWNATKDDDGVTDVGNVQARFFGEIKADDWVSLWNFSECSAQSDGRIPESVKNKKCPSAALNTSQPLSSVSAPTLPSPSSSKDIHASAGPPSKSDEATSRARTALQSRFQALGVSKPDEAIPSPR